LEKGLQAIYFNAMLKVPNLPTMENAKQMQLYNVTWQGTMLDTEALVRPRKKTGETQRDFEEREHTWEMQSNVWNPLKLVVPKPGEVLMNPVDTVPSIAIQRQTMKAYDVHEETLAREVKRTTSRDPRYSGSSGVLFSLVGRDPYEDIEIEKWWSAQWIVVREKGGKFLYVEPNMWGIQPWIQVFGGSATMPSSEPWNARWWVRQSIIWREIPTIRMINQNLVAHQAIIQRKAWARMGTNQQPGEAAAQVNAGLMFGEKDDWWVEQTPELAAQSHQFLSSLNELLERTSYSSVVAGFRHATIDTATGAILASEAAHQTFAANITRLEHLGSISAENFLKLKWQIGKEFGDEKLQEEEYHQIKIGEDVLDDKDIGGKFQIQAQLKQIDPVARQQDVQQVLQLYGMGLAGDEQVYKALGWEDVAGVRKDAIKSLVRRDPEMIEQLKIDAFREEGLHEMADKRQAALDLAKMERVQAEMQGRNGARPIQASGPRGPNDAFAGR